MKWICILVQNFYEMDIRVRRKAEALVAAGYDVEVFALSSPNATSRRYVLNGVNVFTLSLGKQRGSLARYLFEYIAFFAWAFFKLSTRMGQRHYAIVDVNTLPDFLIFAGSIAKLRGAKLVLDMHEITPEFYRSKYGIAESSWVIRFLKWIERISFRFADHVIVINEPIQKLLEARGLTPGKSTIIMNAVDESLFACALAAPAAERAPGKFIMMYHGTLTRLYGLDIAIEAFRKAHRGMPGAELWILGNGPEKKSLEQVSRHFGIDGRVKFIGNVLPQEVPEWLQRCDAGVLPTRSDAFLDFSFSNKLSEYIIMGKPVIVSGLRTIRHYFSENALAFFTPHDADDLARQMTRVFGDAAWRAQLAQRAKQEYAPINWPVMKRQYLNLVEQWAAPPPAPTAALVRTASVTPQRTKAVQLR